MNVSEALKGYNYMHTILMMKMIKKMTRVSFVNVYLSKALKKRYKNVKNVILSCDYENIIVIFNNGDYLNLNVAEKGNIEILSYVNREVKQFVNKELNS